MVDWRSIIRLSAACRLGLVVGGLLSIAWFVLPNSSSLASAHQSASLTTEQAQPDQDSQKPDESAQSSQSSPVSITEDSTGTAAASTAAPVAPLPSTPARPTDGVVLSHPHPYMATDAMLLAPTVAPHNAWVLASAVLVLMMTGPGLAMYYGGLVRKKNVLSMMMQCIFLMGLMSVVWALVGYSLAFGGTSWWFGDFEYVLMRNVARVWDTATNQPLTPMFSDRLPRATHMLFECMFFIIAPAIMCGAFAERMKFSSIVWFSVLWGLLVYCPLAHWVWGGGCLSFGKGIIGGSLDFAGGTVVHISSGIAALVAAIMVGPRLGHRQEPMPPHNLTYTAIGTAMLWVGWFGFNAGNALQIDGVAMSACVATHFGAAAGAVVWAGCEWWQRAKPSVLGACSGAVSGLVGISPAAGHVGPLSALLMGAIAAFTCYLACYRLKAIFGYDDALDAFGVHGIGGLTGALLTGVFATRAVSNSSGGAPIGVIDGSWQLLGGQLVACSMACVYVTLVSFAILKLIDVTLGLRVSSTMERQGLDVTQHGEEGYIFL